jgi:hypothetical protein
MAYSRQSHIWDAENSVYAANVILSSLLERIPPVKSAIDLGCGAGTWLSVLQTKGVRHILGVDGDWVDADVLRIPKTCFRTVDLSRPVALSGRFDLAISLEVAEHLPSERGPGFISTLTELSDFVLFSAAIPYQQGQNHINCQWQEYWAKLFGALGYDVHDFLRVEIWNDKQIPFWYKQDILFFSRQTRSSEVVVKSRIHSAPSMPLNVVHPDWYLPRVNGELGLKATIGLLFLVLRRRLPRPLGRALSRLLQGSG